MKAEIESRFLAFFDAWIGWFIGGFVAVSLIGVMLLVILVVSKPIPTCPDGYTLAGGGYAGRYHCIPGVDPIR